MRATEGGRLEGEEQPHLDNFVNVLQGTVARRTHDSKASPGVRSCPKVDAVTPPDWGPCQMPSGSRMHHMRLAPLVRLLKTARWRHPPTLPVGVRPSVASPESTGRVPKQGHADRHGDARGPIHCNVTIRYHLNSPFVGLLALPLPCDRVGVLIGDRGVAV